jgi:hypothetical protein
MKPRTIKSSCTWSYDLEIGETTWNIEGKVDFMITPGDPGCRYTHNGDGWPPTGPEVEFWNECITGLTISVYDGSHEEIGDVAVPISSLTPAQVKYFTGFFGKVMERLEEDVLSTDYSD